MTLERRPLRERPYDQVFDFSSYCCRGRNGVARGTGDAGGEHSHSRQPGRPRRGRMRRRLPSRTQGRMPSQRLLRWPLLGHSGRRRPGSGRGRTGSALRWTRQTSRVQRHGPLLDGLQLAPDKSRIRIGRISERPPRGGLSFFDPAARAARLTSNADIVTMSARKANTLNEHTELPKFRIWFDPHTDAPITERK